MKQIIEQSIEELDRAEQLIWDERMSETDFQLLMKVSDVEYQIFNSILHVYRMKAGIASVYGDAETKAAFEKDGHDTIDDVGHIDRLLTKLYEAKRLYRYGKISKSEFIKTRKEVNNERLKINSRIKSIQKEIKKALSQGQAGENKAFKIFKEANLYTGFHIDPRDHCISCEKHLKYVLPDDCLEYSQDKFKSAKCADCEHLETVKRLLKEPVTKKKNKADIQIVGEKTIDDAVNFINEKANETLYKGSIEIGEYILKKFFEGDPKLASSKNPKKQQSFSKLCKRDDLIVHPNQLGLMVRVASQEGFFVEQKMDVKILSYTHKATLVKVEDKSKKADMVKECITEKWTTRQLEDTIKEYLNTLPSLSKPSLIRTAKKYITKIDDVLKTVEDTGLKLDKGSVSKMTDKRRGDLKTYLTKLEAKAKEGMDRSKIISEKCGKVLGELAKIEAEKKNKPVKQEKPSTAK